MRDIEPLDQLIASMIAETGEPDEAAQRWVDQAMAAARKARLHGTQNRNSAPNGALPGA